MRIVAFNLFAAPYPILGAIKKAEVRGLELMLGKSTVIRILPFSKVKFRLDGALDSVFVDSFEFETNFPVAKLRPTTDLFNIFPFESKETGPLAPCTILFLSFMKSFMSDLVPEVLLKASRK